MEDHHLLRKKIYEGQMGAHLPSHIFFLLTDGHFLAASSLASRRSHHHLQGEKEKDFVFCVVDILSRSSPFPFLYSPDVFKNCELMCFFCAGLDATLK